MLHKAGIDVRGQHVFDVLLRVGKDQFHGRKGRRRGHLDFRIHLLHHGMSKVQLVWRIWRYVGAVDFGEGLGQFVQKSIVTIYLFGRKQCQRNHFFR